jgi:tetratricopeptide (TPR) repeat protein
VVQLTSRRLVWLFALLTVTLCIWWLLQTSFQISKRLMIEQALQVLKSQPELAEEMLLLADSTGSNPEVLGGLAEAQFQQAKFVEAEETARKWTKLSKTNSLAWKKLAGIQRSQNRIVRAQETLKAGIVFLTDARERDLLREQLIEYFLLADDKNNAFSLIEGFETDTVREAFQQSLNYAQFLRLDGKLSEAYKVIQACLARDNESMPARMLRGVVLLDQQQYQRAADDLAAVIAESPGNKEAHYKLAMALRGLNRLEEATKHLNISRELTDQLEKQMQPTVPGTD